MGWGWGACARSGSESIALATATPAMVRVASENIEKNGLRAKGAEPAGVLMGCPHRAGSDVPPTDKSTAHVGMIDTDRDIDRLSAGVIYLPKARVQVRTLLR